MMRFAGVVWAAAPTFLTGLVDGRPTGVLVHLLLPWIFALLKAWEWVERTARPERWEARQREERDRRQARKDRQR